MTNNNNSNSKNSNNDNNNKNKNINQAVHLMDKWNRQENEFSSSMPKVDVKIRNIETNQMNIVQKPAWPYIKKVDQRVYEKFYSKIVEPTTRTILP